MQLVTHGRQIWGRFSPSGRNRAALAFRSFLAINICLTSFGQAIARSANMGRASASPQIWRPSPIFALRLTWTLSIELSHPLDLGKHESITFAARRSIGEYGPRFGFA